MSRLLALVSGYVLDLLAGDPPWLPHPVAALGRLISLFERLLRRAPRSTPRREMAGGAALVLLVIAAGVGIAWILVHAAGAAHPWARVALEAWIAFQMFAAKSLRKAAMEVHARLSAGDLPGAREAVGRIVGRDTGELDASGVARAAVETVAENCSDGVVAPMLFFAVGGAPLVVFYKAVNTMDSMLGYKNEKYLYFGRSAARLDDAVNYLPARLTALLMLPAALVLGMDWRGAARVLRRDGGNHNSPNAGRPEAACAGALGVRLGGASSYGGTVVDKPVIGDAPRDPAAGDIRRACGLMYAVSGICLVLCCAGVVGARLATGAAGWN